ncbi:MAG: dTDP-4-dehydrorhamnose 3,5-epimerase family protein [Phycisphaerales bacterium]
MSSHNQPCTILAPRRVASSDWPAVHAQAVDANEPLLIPANHYCDDRGWSLMNLFHRVLSSDGQINFSCQYPGVIKAWHRHKFQTDFWLCLTGHLKVGVYRESDHTAWRVVIGEKNPGILVIPPTLWHGAATVGASAAGLLYYVTHAYNPADPDEERRNWESVIGFTWETEFK